MGGRAQAPSLVQGLRPRNAPLQNHRSPTVSAHSSSAAPPTWLPAEYPIRYPEWRQAQRAGQGRHCIWLCSYVFSSWWPHACGMALL